MEIFFDVSTYEFLLNRRNWDKNTGSTIGFFDTTYPLGKLLMDYLDIDFAQVKAIADTCLNFDQPKTITDIKECVQLIRKLFRSLEKLHPLFYNITKEERLQSQHLYWDNWIESSIIENGKIVSLLFDTLKQQLEKEVYNIRHELLLHYEYQFKTSRMVNYCFGEGDIKELASLTPFQRLYIYLRSAHSLANISVCYHLGSIEEDEEDFLEGESLINTIKELSADSPVPLFEVYEGDTESILHFEFIKLLTLGIRITICKNCARFFINSGRSDKLYCDRVIENRSCKEVGASNAYKQKVKDDPILELYQRAYKRHYGKVTNNRMSKKEFFAWAEKAKFMRELVGSGEIDFSTYKNWMDLKTGKSNL